MDAHQLQRILANGEDSKHQFKREITRLDSLIAEFAAFSNNSGRCVFMGLEDNGSINGIYRTQESWPIIELQNHKKGNEFKVILIRPEPELQVAPVGIGADEAVVYQVLPSKADPVTDSDLRLLQTLIGEPKAPSVMQADLGLKQRPTFRDNYLYPP